MSIFTETFSFFFTFFLLEAFIQQALINEGLPQPERLQKLNSIAISQMKILTEDNRMSKLDDKGATQKSLSDEGQMGDA